MPEFESEEGEFEVFCETKRTLRLSAIATKRLGSSDFLSPFVVLEPRSNVAGVLHKIGTAEEILAANQPIQRDQKRTEHDQFSNALADSILASATAHVH